jgi:hypothetical protein
MNTQQNLIVLYDVLGALALPRTCYIKWATLLERSGTRAQLRVMEHVMGLDIHIGIKNRNRKQDRWEQLRPQKRGKRRFGGFSGEKASFPLL